jgi:large subunit ribosomal protein L17
MRHNKKNNHLGRTSSHRDALLSNMACSLIKHKRIFTTVPKARELRKFVEPLITKSKDDTTHSRRIVFKNLQNKYAVTELFKEISQKIGDRPGGYTRIIKTGYRLGDNAAMCFIELVDYNENMLKTKVPAKAKTRRSRRKSGESVGAGAVVTETHKKTKVPKTTEKELVEVAQPVVENEVTSVTEIEALTGAELQEEVTKAEVSSDESSEAEVPKGE